MQIKLNARFAYILLHNTYIPKEKMTNLINYWVLLVITVT